MHRRTVGVVLIGISAFIYGIRLITASIIGTSSPGWYGNKYDEMLDSIGNGPVIVSWITLVTGLIYLVLAEGSIKKLLSKHANKIKENWNQP